MQVKALIILSLALFALVQAEQEHPATEVKRCKSKQINLWGIKIIKNISLLRLGK